MHPHQSAFGLKRALRPEWNALKKSVDKDTPGKVGKWLWDESTSSEALWGSGIGASVGAAYGGLTRDKDGQRGNLGRVASYGLLGFKTGSVGGTLYKNRKGIFDWGKQVGGKFAQHYDNQPFLSNLLKNKTATDPIPYKERDFSMDKLFNS